MPPTTETCTFGCAWSYSATTFLNTPSSRALQPTQIVSFVGEADRAVLEAIRDGAPISRAEIARRTGISKPTVSLALRALFAGGVVRQTDPDPRRPHYGATFFEPVPEAALVLGLDIGARFMRSAV